MVRNVQGHVIGAFDAKTVFGQLLNRVENGETIIITRHGAPVARLVPYEEPIDATLVEEAISEVAKLRKGIKLGGITVRELIDEGRRM